MSTKPYGVPQKGKSIHDQRGREEQEFKLNMLLKELDLKQKQMMKLLDARDKAEAKHKLRAQK